MSVQKFIGTIETDGVKDERGIETPSLSATGEVSGKTGVFTESVTAPVFNGKATSAGSADSATNATNDGTGNNIPDTYATKEALAEETSAREAADETLSSGITAEATARAQEISALQTGLTGGTITVAQATHAASADSATNATNAGTASTANALSQSGCATKLWSGNWDGTTTIDVSSLSSYTQLIVLVQDSGSNNVAGYYICSKNLLTDKTSPVTKEYSWSTNIGGQIAQNTGMFYFICLIGNGAQLVSARKITFGFLNTEAQAMATDSGVIITEIWGVETTKNPS